MRILSSNLPFFVVGIAQAQLKQPVNPDPIFPILSVGSTLKGQLAAW